MIKTGTAPVLVESIDSEKTPLPEPEAVVQIQPGSVQPLSAVQTAQPVKPAAAWPPAVSSIQPSVSPLETESRPGPALLKGAVPGEGAALADEKLYRIQVGAYVQPRNAVEAFDKLKRVGLDPAYEKYNDFYRVVVAGIKNAEVRTVAEKIGQAGFREAIIREE
jgi:rare lipoprotein A